jgi:hypothetical protein
MNDHRPVDHMDSANELSAKWTNNFQQKYPTAGVLMRVGLHFFLMIVLGSRPIFVF